MNAFGVTAITSDEKEFLTERKILSARERKAERAKGKAEGKTNNQIKNVQSLMSNLKLSFTEAAGLLNISDDEQENIRKLIAPKS